MHALLPLGFRRVAICCGVATSPLAVSFESSGGTEPEFRPIYNRRLTMDAIASTKVYRSMYPFHSTMLTRNIQRACASILYPLLKREQDHCSSERTVYRRRELHVRVTCGVCTRFIYIISPKTNINFQTGAILISFRTRGSAEIVEESSVTNALGISRILR